MGLRIVQVVEKLEIGGLERMALDLAIAQKAAGHQPSIYCVFQRGALADEAEAAGVPITEFRKDPGFSWQAIRQMERCLRSDHAQVVHTHNSVIHHYGVLAGRLARVPVVVNTRHGLGTLHTARRQERYFRATFPFTDAFVFVCQDGQRFFQEHLGVPAKKSRVILNGIPLEKFRELRPSIGSCRPAIRFGTLGRMVPAKAHCVLLQAFAQLRGRFPQAHLRIAGGGPLEGELREQVQALGLEGAVCVEGATREVARFLSQLDVFVLSSITEGLPLVILEAMASGLPVVSTNVGGIPEVAGPEVGWLCPPGDAGCFAEALYCAATAPDLHERGERARCLAFSRYGLEQMQQHYADLFSSLLG